MSASNVFDSMTEPEAGAPDITGMAFIRGFVRNCIFR